MSEVRVKTMDVEIRTTKLTKSLLKQFRVLYNFSDVRPYLPGGHEAQAEGIGAIGWVAGSVLDPQEDYAIWLVIRVGEGDYARFRCTPDLAGKFSQIYVV